MKIKRMTLTTTMVRNGRYLMEAEISRLGEVVVTAQEMTAEDVQRMAQQLLAAKRCIEVTMLSE